MDDQNLLPLIEDAIAVRSRFSESKVFLTELDKELAIDVIRAGCCRSESFARVAAKTLSTREVSIREEPRKHAEKLLSTRKISVSSARDAVYSWAREEDEVLEDWVSGISANPGQQGAQLSDSSFHFFPGLVGQSASIALETHGSPATLKVLLAIWIIDTKLRPYLDSWFEGVEAADPSTSSSGLRRVGAFETALKELSARLSDESDRITETLAAPSADAVADLSSSLRRVNEEGIQLAGEFPTGPGESREYDGDRPLGVFELREALNRASLRAKTDTDDDRSWLFEALERLASLHHVNQPDFEPLTEVADAIRAFKVEIEGLSPTAIEQHPVLCLDKVIREPALADSLAERIGADFSMRLLVAASSGQLRFGGADVEDQDPTAIGPPASDEPEIDERAERSADAGGLVGEGEASASDLELGVTANSESDGMEERQQGRPAQSSPELQGQADDKWASDEGSTDTVAAKRAPTELPGGQVNEGELAARQGTQEAETSAHADPMLENLAQGREEELLAAELLGYDISSAPEPLLRALAFSLVGSGDYAYAYHVARYAPSWDDVHLPLWLLEALCCQRRLKMSQLWRLKMSHFGGR